jgi:WbqC-like protein family
MTVVSPFYTFPPIGWWRRFAGADTLIVDAGEHYQKMSYRNRYRICGSNNPVLLSIPLTNGRNQHTPVHEVRIHNEARWQTQHWRTLVSVYKRSPFFDHYEDSLRALYETEYTLLVDFNKAALEWVKQQLKLRFEIQEADFFVKDYPEDVIDLRKNTVAASILPKYYQVFEDRVGFIPDLSILDLMFSEGPRAVDLLIG